MCIGELSELCTCWCFVILVHLVISNDDVYLVKWWNVNYMYMIGWSFSDDNFLVCNFEMLNCDFELTMLNEE